MCGKSLLGLPSMPDLPPPPKVEEIPEPKSFETADSSDKTGRGDLKIKLKSDLTTSGGTGLSIPK